METDLICEVYIVLKKTQSKSTDANSKRYCWRAVRVYARNGRPAKLSGDANGSRPPATGCSWARAPGPHGIGMRTDGMARNRVGWLVPRVFGGWMSPAAVATPLPPFVFAHCVQTAWNNTAPFSFSLTKVLAYIERKFGYL